MATPDLLTFELAFNFLIIFYIFSKIVFYSSNKIFKTYLIIKNFLLFSVLNVVDEYMEAGKNQVPVFMTAEFSNVIMPID